MSPDFHMPETNHQTPVISDLYQEFSKLDRNGSGNMNVHDLGKCLNSLGFSVVEGELEYLQKNFDRDGKYGEKGKVT